MILKIGTYQSHWAADGVVKPGWVPNEQVVTELQKRWLTGFAVIFIH